MNTLSQAVMLILLLLAAETSVAQFRTPAQGNDPAASRDLRRIPSQRTTDLINRSASFDGTDDYITMGIDAAHQITNTLTVEAWIKPSANLGYAGIINNLWETSGNKGGFGLTMGGVSANIMFAVTTTASATYLPATIPALNQWVHVAGTFDGSTMRVYINGIETATTAKTGSITYASPNDLMIGRYWDNNESYYYTGAVDDVRLWNIVRTQSEIANNRFTELIGNESGLAGYWKLNEGSGISANDETANNKDGVLTNGVAWLSESGLPVELSSFSAVQKGNGVELKWRTATEVNNYGFEVERRTIDNGQLTMENWKKAGFVEGNGTSNVAHEYAYTDRVVSAGTIAYRLKQIDRDGKFTYSQEIEINVGSSVTTFELQQNYPNPFNPQTVITYQIPDFNHVSISVYDAVGREVEQLVNEVKHAGTHSVLFNGSRHASGIYVAKLASGGHTQIRKMLLMK